MGRKKRGVKEVDRFRRSVLSIATSGGDKEVHASALVIPNKGELHFPHIHFILCFSMLVGSYMLEPATLPGL